MRITVTTPIGNIYCETDDVGEVAALVKALCNGTAPSKPIPYELADEWGSTEEYVNQPIEEGTVTLSPTLAETWEWLVKRGGVHTPRGLAKGMSITAATPSFRIGVVLIVLALILLLVFLLAGTGPR
jgi:hypothetical protein